MHAQQHNTGLPPPSVLGGSQGFGLGNTNASASPFSVAGSINSGGFERGLADSGGAGLGSHAAQMSFARGGPVQQNATREFEGMSQRDTKQGARIRNVWKTNLAAEMETLRQLVEDYPYIAMDTEFPGIVARPIGSFSNKADYHYQTLRCNVDLLKMIQLGITLFAPDGSLPPATSATSANAQTNYMANMIPAPYTWQFNFRFSLNSDMYAQESTSMLSKAGIDFALHEKNGIEPRDFGALLMSSGLVLDEDVHWISFHSGYDFGYLMKIMLCKPLPDDEAEFHKLLMIFFPSLYDIKFLLKHAGRNNTVNNNQPLSADAQSVLQRLSTKSGLQDIGEELEVRRVGIAHQAGSDSLLTGQIYFKMREKVFGGTIEESKYSGQVWGLNAQMSGMGSRDLNTPNMNGATFYNQNGTPSTPQGGNAGLAQNQTHTPAPQSALSGTLSSTGHLTPGGGGFGQFQYASRA